MNKLNYPLKIHTPSGTLKITEEEISADSLKIIRGKRKGAFPYCNTIVLGDKKLKIIDPHCSKEKMKKLSRSTEQLILSHYHTDHTFNHELFTCPVWAPERDKPAFISLTEFARHMGIKNSPFENLWLERVAEQKWKIRKADYFYSDREIINADGLEVIAVNLPGHTAGHSGFFIPAYSMLFTTDIDFTNFGPWYGNASSSAEEYLASLDKILTYNPEIVVTSHERWFIKSSELEMEIKRYKDIIYRRESIILEKLKDPISLEELTEQYIIYGKSTKRKDFMITFMEWMNVKKHLEKLIKEGIVIKENNRYVRIE